MISSFKAFLQDKEDLVWNDPYVCGLDHVAYNHGFHAS